MVNSEKHVLVALVAIVALMIDVVTSVPLDRKFKRAIFTDNQGFYLGGGSNNNLREASQVFDLGGPIVNPWLNPWTQPLPRSGIVALAGTIPIPTPVSVPTAVPVAPEPVPETTAESPKYESTTAAPSKYYYLPAEPATTAPTTYVRYEYSTEAPPPPTKSDYRYEYHQVPAPSTSYSYSSSSTTKPVYQSISVADHKKTYGFSSSMLQKAAQDTNQPFTAVFFPDQHTYFRLGAPTDFNTESGLYTTFKEPTQH